MFFVCLMPVMRSSRNVLRSAHICHAFLSKCPVFDHACCLPPVRQTERLAICCVPIPPWVVIAIRAFSDVAWLSGFVGSLRDCAFPYGDPDGERRDARDGERSRRRDRVRFCVIVLALPCFPRGVRWGEMWKPHCGRAPDCAKETSLPGLSSFDSRCGCVSRGEGRSGTTKA